LTTNLEELTNLEKKLQTWKSVAMLSTRPFSLRHFTELRSTASAAPAPAAASSTAEEAPRGDAGNGTSGPTKAATGDECGLCGLRGLLIARGDENGAAAHADISGDVTADAAAAAAGLRQGAAAVATADK
jgi:hypothetical protein